MANRQTSEVAFDDDGTESGLHRVSPEISTFCHTVMGFELPDIPELERVPRRLLEEDEDDLRWRLSDPLVASLTGGSSMGAWLARAESYGYGALPCRRCGGRWKARRRKRDGELVIVGWRDGTGRMPLKQHLGPKAGQRLTYRAALAAYRKREVAKHRIVVIPRLQGQEQHVREETFKAFWSQGQMCVTPDVLAAMYPTLPEELSEPCEKCDGLGVVPRSNGRKVEVTVWPKGSSVRLGGREGLDADGIMSAAAAAYGSAKPYAGIADAGAFVAVKELDRYRRVEKLLADAASVAVIARVALEEYYAPRREDYAMFLRAPRFARDGKPWDRIADLTPAANEPEALRGPDSLWRARVASQAAELYSFSCQVFNLVAYGNGGPA